MYARGEGVPKDWAEALAWYRKAADQGYAPAQYSLGVMYDERQVETRRTGVYLRRIWYLYELLTGRVLDLPRATGPYIPLADPELYYTTPVRRSRRHKVDDNLLGVAGFAVVVRKTPTLAAFAARRLADRARSIVAAHDGDTLHRAISWLYAKETRSSFAIEHEEPSPQRLERFVQLLRQAPRVERLDEATLVELQRATVDPRFANDGWREEQSYVGETVGYTQRVHFVAPKPEDLDGLMDDFLLAVERLEASALEPVLVAAVVSFGFVFLHPFSEGTLAPGPHARTGLEARGDRGDGRLHHGGAGQPECGRSAPPGCSLSSPPSSW